MIARRLFAVVLALPLAVAGCGAGPGSSGEDITRHWYAGRVLYEINVPELSADGTLDGLVPHLDRLGELGLRVLVLNPIHPRGGVAALDTMPAHPYSVTDHLGVAKELGGRPAFRRFVAAAHERGFRVVLDMVFNHGALDHVERARHPEWFARTEDGQPARRIPTWRTVVDFAHDHEGARAYQQQVLRTWCERGVDGFRFLHANLQPSDFWQATLASIRRSHPDLYLIADAKNPRFLAAGFDAIYKPHYFEASTFAILDDVAQLGLQDDMWYATVDTSYGIGVRGTTFLEDRFGRRTPEVFRWPLGKGYVAGLLTLPGSPKLYNGQEWGCRTEPDLMRPAAIDPAEAHEGWSAHYRELLALRTASDALRRGEPRRVPAAERELLVFTRAVPDELVLVAINLTDTAPEFTLPSDLRERDWHPWRGGRFADPAERLDGEIRLEPCGYRAWRAAP